MEMQLLLTAVQPIAHQDPAKADGSNTLTFNRRKQIVSRGPDERQVEQADIDHFCQAHSLPFAVHEAVRHLTFPEFVAVALCATLIDLYNSQDGEGLFSGVERYEMLETRLTHAAIQSSTLFGLWAGVTNALQLPPHPAHADDLLLTFWGLPRSVQLRALTAITGQARSVVSLARLWASQRKLHSAEYAAKAGQLDLVGRELLTAAFDVAALPDHVERMTVETPTVTGNTARHQIVRAPAWRHFCRILEIPAAYPGQGDLPASVEAIFTNGGNIQAGAKQPTNSFALAGRIRAAFPSLDLLGGTTDSFDLGESALKVSSWIVCRENRYALPGEIANLPEASISVFDMLDEHTETRQASKHGVGQMIRNFETLAPGTKLFVRLVLDPFVQPLTAGALACAVAEYCATYPVVAGQSARGYGLMQPDVLRDDLPDDVAEQYETYLRNNQEDLSAWMRDGTLGCGSVVLS